MYQRHLGKDFKIYPRILRIQPGQGAGGLCFFKCALNVDIPCVRGIVALETKCAHLETNLHCNIFLLE